MILCIPSWTQGVGGITMIEDSIWVTFTVSTRNISGNPVHKSFSYVSISCVLIIGMSKKQRFQKNKAAHRILPRQEKCSNIEYMNVLLHQYQFSSAVCGGHML